MSLYKLFCSQVEIHYKSYFISKATLFVITTTLLNIILPFIIAYRSRGFWLKSHYFYEQPTIRSTYDYLLIAQTNDPTINILCGGMKNLPEGLETAENCSETQIEESDYNKDGKSEILEYKFKLNIPPGRHIASLLLFIGLDFQTMITCPLQIQSLVIINKDFSLPPNEVNINGHVQFYQTSHLPCLHNVIDTRYNVSIFNYESERSKNIVEFVFEQNLQREVTTQLSNIHTRTENGNTGFMIINIALRVPEMKFRYKPSFFQELKWAWPQYLSLAIVIQWILYKIKLFVFRNRLLMAWEVVPWNKGF